MLAGAAIALAVGSTQAAPSEDPIAGAEAAAASGDFVAAAASYKRAYAADPRPELICNVGVAYYKAKQLPRAQLFLSRCLERGSALDGKFVDSVRKVLASVESTLRAGAYTPVDLVAEPAGATVIVQAFGDDESFIGSRVVWLAEGKQTLVARAEGYEDLTLDVDVTGHERQTVRLALERPRVVVSPAQIGSESSSSSDHAIVAPIVEAKPVAPSLVPALVSTGITAGAVVLAVIAHGKAADRADLAQFALTQEAYDADRNAVSQWNSVTGVSIGIAAAGAAVSGYLFYRAFNARSQVEVNATSQGGAVAISGRW